MFKEIKPRSPVLREYIISYNIPEERSLYPLHYCAFPQPGTSLAFFNHTDLKIDRTEVTLSPDKNQPVRMAVLGKYLVPVIIRYSGFINEVSINFKPAAINHFFDLPFSKLAPACIQQMDAVDPAAIPEELFQPDTDKKIAVLEKFLLERMNLKPLQQLEKAIALLEEDETIDISRLTSLVNLTERTLARYFNLYVGCPPSVFKRILRFRKSIDLKFLDSQHVNCTDICFSNSFYDTAHFRKEFRRLTGQNPGDFFDTLSLIGEGKYPFRLV